MEPKNPLLFKGYEVSTISDGIPDRIINEHGCRNCEYLHTDLCPNKNKGEPPICRARVEWLRQFLSDRDKPPTLNEWDLMLNRYKGNDILRTLERTWRVFEKEMLECLEREGIESKSYYRYLKSYEINYKNWFELFRTLITISDNAAGREVVRKVHNTNVEVNAKPSDINDLIRGSKENEY